MKDDLLASVMSTARALFGDETMPDDGFFDVGGDSVTAVEFAVRVAESTGVQLEVADLIDATDFAALADDLASRPYRPCP